MATDLHRKRLILGKALLEAVEISDLSLIRSLLDNGADPNILLSNGITPFHIAVGNESTKSEAIVNLCLQHGANPNKRSAEGMSPVHVAATWGRVHILQMLLQHGGDPFLKDQDGEDAIEMARVSGHEGMVQYIEDELGSYSEEKTTPRYTKKRLGSADTYEEVLNPSESCRRVYGFDHPAGISCDVGYPLSHTGLSKTCLAGNHAVSDCQITPQQRCQCSHQRQVLGSDFRTFPSPGYLQFRRRSPQHEATPNWCHGAGDWVQQSQLRTGNLKTFNSPDNSRRSTTKAWIKSQSPQAASASLSNDRSVIDSVVANRPLCRNSGYSRSDKPSPKSPPDRYQIGSDVKSSPALLPDDKDPKAHDFIDDIDIRFDKMTIDDCDASSIAPSIGDLPSVDDFWAENELVNVATLPSPGKNASLTALPDDSFSSCKSSVSHISLKELTNGVDKSCQCVDLDSTLETTDEMPPTMCPKFAYERGDGALVSCDETFDISPCDQRRPVATPNASEIWTDDESIDENVNASVASKASSERKSRVSDASSGTVVEYIYTDDEGHALIERHCIVSDVNTTNSDAGNDSNATILYDWKNWRTSERAGNDVKRRRKPKSSSSAASGDDDNDELLSESLSIPELRRKLVEHGETPGPITIRTKKPYLRRLKKLMKDPAAVAQAKDGYLPELAKALNGRLNLDGLDNTEQLMVKAFQEPNPTRRWREGNQKSSFNYLLLDPRVTKNLPCRAGNFDDVEKFKIFSAAVFYIGKGKRARPYSHFHEALTALKTQQQKPLPKVKQILDIWDANLGVVSLHCFQNVIPVEAYTREACMIDALGLERLTNVKTGNYYGVAATWQVEKRRIMGVHLLLKAMKILCLEGERQIRPADIKSH